MPVKAIQDLRRALVGRSTDGCTDLRRPPKLGQLESRVHATDEAHRDGTCSEPVRGGGGLAAVELNDAIDS